MEYWKQGPDNIYVAGHRGWLGRYPENTMVSFIAAAELGVDQIETDVRATEDGELVLMHDSKVDRTTDGTGYVREMSWAKLRTLDAGMHKGAEFAGARVPLFDEFLSWVKEDCPALILNIELKDYPKDVGDAKAHDVCDRALAMIDGYGLEGRVVITTFSGALQEYIYGKYGSKYPIQTFFPASHLGAMAGDPYAFPYSCCMYAREKGMPTVCPEDYRAMAERGVQPWGPPEIKTGEEVDAAIAGGVCIITSNHPDEMLDMLRSRGRHR